MFADSIFADIREGNAILVTGAGVSSSGQNKYGRPILGVRELAEEIARQADFTYVDEELSEVFDASLTKLGDAKLKTIFESNFLETKPSSDLATLLSIPWRRIYTFNIDDNMERVPYAKRVQKLRFYNALKDRRVEWQGYDECQVVYLHGSASQYDSGFVFSSDQYADIAARNPAWYSQLGEDFIDFTVIFVGSRLREHILFQTIRGALARGTLPGRSFCITPDNLSAIQLASLEKRGIFHIPATLDDFAQEVRRRYPGGLQARDLATKGIAAGNNAGAQFAESDVEALRSVFPIHPKELDKRFPHNTIEENKAKRRYYEGYGPTWPIILSGAYARLGQFSQLESDISSAYKTSRAVVLLGEAGSGKSTFLMHLCLELSKSDKAPLVFEYQEGTASFSDVMYSLKKFRGDRLCVVLIDDLHVVAEDVSDVLSDSSMEGATIISSARTSEWNEKIGKFFSGNVRTLRLERFKQSDVPQIIRAIENNFAAPKFNKLTREDKEIRFRKSNRQLLIALLEATESKGFEEIIEDEYARIEDIYQRLLLLAVAIATVPRVGMSKSMASTILLYLRSGRSFDELYHGLDRIVDIAASGRFQARHQVYAAEIVRKHSDIDELSDVLRAMVKYYTEFSSPIIKNVSRHDGQLFKYLLNNNNIYQIFKSSGRREESEGFFRQFEVLLQLDGHYWLQYALLLRRLRRHKEALDMLDRSIAAYPGNLYAHHALAQQKLILAAQQSSYSQQTRSLINDAVTALMERHHAMDFERQRGAIDEYPIVSLGYYHIDALEAHGQRSESRAYARRYYRELERIAGRRTGEILDGLRQRLILLATTGEWKRLKYREGQIEYS